MPWAVRRSKKRCREMESSFVPSRAVAYNGVAWWRTQMQNADVLRLAEVMSRHEIEYMIIGKGAAIIQGFSGATQDVDIYPSKKGENRQRLLAALRELGFAFDVEVDGVRYYPSSEILEGKDFIQLKGPFELDIVFAPDGFESYEEALPMKRTVENLPVMSIEGILRTKTAAGRRKDLNDLDDLRLFAAWLKKKGC